MKRDDVLPYVGKRVKLTRKDGYFFTGVIREVNGETALFFDKFDQRHAIDIEFIASIEPWGARHG